MKSPRCFQTALSRNVAQGNARFIKFSKVRRTPALPFGVVNEKPRQRLQEGGRGFFAVSYRVMPKSAKLLGFLGSAFGALLFGIFGNLGRRERHDFNLAASLFNRCNSSL